MQKWENEQRLLPLKERRKCPEPPSNFDMQMEFVKAQPSNMRKQDLMI